MSNTFLSLDLIRYLFVLEVNAPMVWLPHFPAQELSLLLSEKIADRLPTTEARSWKKAMAAWHRGESSKSKQRGRIEPTSDTPWPIDAILFWYPIKRSFGKGERILFELKLFGDAADHDYFMEVILPAMEEIAMMPHHQSKQNHPLWGRFDIRSIYSAKGVTWKPLLKNGRLDLRRKVNAAQWATGLQLGKIPSRHSNPADQLTWLSPFSIEGLQANARGTKGKGGVKAPTLTHIVGSVAERVCQILLGKYAGPEDFVTALDHDARLSLSSAMRSAEKIGVSHHRIRISSSIFHAMGEGTQSFKAPIPHDVIPYLELGSILHIGKRTHFGCGTFTIHPERSVSI